MRIFKAALTVFVLSSFWNTLMGEPQAKGDAPADIHVESIPFRSDREAEEFLRTAKIVSRKHVGEGINNPLRVVLEKGGIRFSGIFRDVHVSKLEVKLRDGTTKRNFRDDAIFECAAYALNRLLGLDNVPPTVRRKVGGKSGTLQTWVPNAITEKERVEKQIQFSRGLAQWRWAVQWQIVYIFDNLIANEDRNRGNILLDPEGKLWMIDHTRAFRRQATLPYPEKIEYCEKNLWDKLRTLKDEELTNQLDDFLTRIEDQWCAGATTNVSQVYTGTYSRTWRKTYLIQASVDT